MKTALLITLVGVACTGFTRESQSRLSVPVNSPAPETSVAAKPLATRLDPVNVRVRSLHRLMEVQVTMASGADRDTQFEYSLRWFDANGILIPSFSGCWFPEEIPGQGTAIIFEMAPSPDAVTLNLECREVFRTHQGRSHSQPLSLCINSDSNYH